MSDLIMRFDPKTIEHLWISLYAKLPTVIAELISNSWDADADNIIIDFIDNQEDKVIVFKDDWVWMSFDEINDKFLVIGRNRRKDLCWKTVKGRNVIGKKGLGKLSVFWIAKEIEVITIKDKIKNHFLMCIDDILNTEGGIYNPTILAQNKKTDEENWTILLLKQIKRKSDFEIEAIIASLSKKFIIFDQIAVNILHNGKEKCILTNEKKFESFDIQFSWVFPNESFSFEYDEAQNIKGRIITLRTPIKDPEMRGIYLTSRGKIVNIASFYWVRDNDQFHTYITWYLQIDFIDNLDEDIISTDRQSLNWEHENAKKLESFLQATIKQIQRERRTKRAEEKAEKIKEETKLDTKERIESLPMHVKDLWKKIINPILEDPSINTKESVSIISSVINKFDNEDYKEYAFNIADIAKPEDIPQLIKLMNNWKVVEMKQFSDLALTRIEVIKKFESLIYGDTLEVPTLHNFLKQFTRILDPRILEFKDEVAYSKLLKENFSEEQLEEKDRRIDFLCSNALWEILYVIEIKRSKSKIGLKELEQWYDYQSFLKQKYSSQTWFSKVVCYIIWWEKDTDYKFKNKEETYRKSWEVFVKTYKELLEQAKQYHREFIEKFNELQK